MRNGDIEPQRILVTGFGAFGSVRDNPSERLLTYVADEKIRGAILSTCLLPVSFSRAPELLQAALELGQSSGTAFDDVLMLGVAGGSATWRVETLGRNHVDREADVEGWLPPSTKIYPGAPDTLPSTLPTSAIFASLTTAGLPASRSDSAGGYLCNYVLYTTLYYLRSMQARTRAGFLHIPADEFTFDPDLVERPLFVFDQHVAAIDAALDAVVGTGSLPNPVTGMVGPGTLPAARRMP